MVANINSSLPIQIPSPRYLIIDPTISRAQAQVRADGRADRAFGIKSLLGRSEASARAMQLCLAPFWSLRLRVQLRYHRPVTYRLAPQDADARETELEGTDGRRLTLAITPQVKELTVRGVEHCLAERDSAALVDAYGGAGGESLTQRAMARLGREQDRLRPLLANPARQVSDLGAFFVHKRLDGKALYDEWRDEDVLAAAPAESVNHLLASLVNEIVAGLGEVLVQDWRITVEAADLYFRPLYLFEFQRTDKAGNVAETKVEQMNALTGDWMPVPAGEDQPAPPWETALARMTPDAGELLSSLGGPWLRAGGEAATPAPAMPVAAAPASAAPAAPTAEDAPLAAPADEAVTPEMPPLPEVEAEPVEGAAEQAGDAGVAVDAAASDAAPADVPPPPPPPAGPSRLAPAASSADNDEDA